MNNKRLDFIAAIDRLIMQADDMEVPRDMLASYRAQVVVAFAGEVANEAKNQFVARAGALSAATEGGTFE